MLGFKATSAITLSSLHTSLLQFITLENKYRQIRLFLSIQNAHSSYVTRTPKHHSDHYGRVLEYLCWLKNPNEQNKKIHLQLIFIPVILSSSVIHNSTNPMSKVVPKTSQQVRLQHSETVIWFSGFLWQPSWQ